MSPFTRTRTPRASSGGADGGPGAHDGRWGTGRTRWLIDLPKIGGHEQGRTHSGWCAHEQRCSYIQLLHTICLVGVCMRLYACACMRTVRYAATECTPASRDVGGRWGQEGETQGTAARSYTPLHATGLHTLPWPTCAWAGSCTSMPHRCLKTRPRSSCCSFATWAYISSASQASATNL
jgi:hypothetical protein